MRTLSHLPIFQGFVALYHALYHRHMDCSIRGHMSDPCRFSRSDKRTDLSHSMGHLNQRCTVLSVVCRHTFALNIRYYLSPVAPLLRPIIARLRRTVVHYRYQTLRHSFAPTPCTSGKLAERVGLEPTHEGVKVPCLNRLATAQQWERIAPIESSSTRGRGGVRGYTATLG